MTNWEKYFETPEQTAALIENACIESTSGGCEGCVLWLLIPEKKDRPCGDVLTWLNADADAEYRCEDCEA